MSIVDESSGPFLSLGQYPTINNAGLVAFEATSVGNEGIVRGVYTSNGGQITTIADSRGPFEELGLPSINDEGTVAFWANHDTYPPGGGYFISNGGAAINVFTDNRTVQRGGFGFPSINASGIVAFQGVVEGGRGILTGNGGPLIPIAVNGELSVGAPSVPTINRSGTVAFAARVEGPRGIHIGNGGPLTTVVDDRGPFRIFSVPAINDSGSIAFYAELDDGMQGIFKIGNDGKVTNAVDFDGPLHAGFLSIFSASLGPSINASGGIAFPAWLDSGGFGIFTGPDPVADRVIQSGDQLFGSTVRAVEFSRGLNDHGDVAFYYVLENGVEGIAVALLVPEPRTLFQGLLLLLALFTSVRVRHFVRR